MLELPKRDGRSSHGICTALAGHLYQAFRKLFRETLLCEWLLLSLSSSSQYEHKCSVAAHINLILLHLSFFSAMPRAMLEGSSGILPFQCTRAHAMRNFVAIWPCPVQTVQGH